MKGNLIKLCALFVLNGCYYGINEKTSEIGNLHTECLENDTWVKINADYSVNKITDTLFFEGLEKIKLRTFKTEILYFEEPPKELIAIAEDHYSVRYVFNPKISRQSLDGLSMQLDNTEKKRIRDRVQKILMKYQCEEGRKESQQLVNSSSSDL